MAVFVLTTFFASDDDFVDPNNHSEFTKAMLARNCFLFKQNQGGDKKVHVIIVIKQALFELVKIGMVRLVEGTNGAPSICSSFQLCPGVSRDPDLG